jgi:membrane-bound lytic murein transglycosylase F
MDLRLEVVGAETANALPVLLDAGRVDAIVVPQSLAAGRHATSPLTMSEDTLLLLDQVELLVWSTRSDAPALSKAIDAWVKKQRDGEWMMALVDKYFPKQAPPVEEAPKGPSFAAKTLSTYDAIAQKYSTQYGLDWRFITAQMWQESRFNPKAKSWVGALGLMQVMPKTGEEIGILPLDDPDKGLHAGVKYMKKMMGRVAKEISPNERLNFALAAYNAGFGHVIDARKLTTDLGLDPNVWFGNAEEGLKLLEKKEYAAKARYGYCRAKETVGYVKNIRAQAKKYGFENP